MNKENLEKNIPHGMKDLKQWCVFRAEPDEKGHYAKRILNPFTGRWAACDNPRSWATYEIAVKQAEKYNNDGVAFCIVKENGITCIDLDDSIGKDGKQTEVAKEFLNEFGETYAERSLSGKGIHIFLKGSLHENAGKKNQATGIEMYDTGRFICMTGDSLNGKKIIANYQDKLTEKNEKYMGAPRTPLTVERIAPSLNDKQLIDKICSSKQSAKFKDLYAGGCPFKKSDGSPDYSSADFSMCLVLAFWTRDPSQIDRIFRSSGLYGKPRPGEKGIKWDKPMCTGTYGSFTIDNALRKVSAVRDAKYTNPSSAVAQFTNASPQKKEPHEPER